jgi:hypothetical protein
MMIARCLLVGFAGRHHPRHSSGWGEIVLPRCLWTRQKSRKGKPTERLSLDENGSVGLSLRSKFFSGGGGDAQGVTRLLEIGENGQEACSNN